MSGDTLREGLAPDPAHWIEPATAVGHLTTIRVEADAARCLRQGGAVPWHEEIKQDTGGPIAVMDEGGPDRHRRDTERTLGAEEDTRGLRGPMKVYAIDTTLPSGLPKDDREAVVTIGTFDGVDRGHWEVLSEIRRRAEAENGRRRLGDVPPSSPQDHSSGGGSADADHLRREKKEILARIRPRLCGLSHLFRRCLPRTALAVS